MCIRDSLPRNPTSHETLRSHRQQWRRSRVKVIVLRFSFERNSSAVAYATDCTIGGCQESPILYSQAIALLSLWTETFGTVVLLSNMARRSCESSYAGDVLTGGLQRFGERRIETLEIHKHFKTQAGKCSACGKVTSNAIS